MSKGASTTTAEIPEWQKQQQQEVFQAAKGLAGTPFVPYTGPRVAGFNPDQLRQFQATRGLFETGMQYDPLTGLQSLAQQQAPQIGQVGSLLGADIGAYQSPYTEQVIEQSMADIQRQADIARRQAQSQAIGAGAFGGSRSALLETESQRPYIEQQARTAAGLRQAGFEQAQRAAESDIARQQQMAMFAPELELRARQQQAGLLGGVGAEQAARLGQLGQIGQQQQLLQQQALGVPYQEFQRALGYGPQQLGLLQAGLGTPLVGQTTQQKTGTGDILGTAAQLAGMYFLSDERLKENIKPIGKSENGHNLYTWDWNDKAKELGVNDPTTGVIAQEIMKYMPEAVITDKNGYYMVNYGVL
ncbi:MAG: tail fiber domain-containing protein [Candidatus Nanopelagicales bacterium]